MHALMVAHFLWGAYYPVGSAESIPRELLHTVSENGGWTAIRTEVVEILVARSNCVGVLLGDGREIHASRRLQTSPLVRPTSVSTSDLKATSDVGVVLHTVGGFTRHGIWNGTYGMSVLVPCRGLTFSIAAFSHSRIRVTIRDQRCAIRGKSSPLCRGRISNLGWDRDGRRGAMNMTHSRRRSRRPS